MGENGMSGICGHRLCAARFGGALLTAVLVAGISGCTGGGGGEMEGQHKRATASGSVTFKGQPIPAGTVVFTNHESGIQSTCLIDDGTYESESGEGPVNGKNTVNVIGLEAEGGKPQWSGVWKEDVQIDGETFEKSFEVKEEQVKPYKDLGADEEGALYE
jgi:hypothetical protein